LNSQTVFTQTIVPNGVTNTARGTRGLDIFTNAAVNNQVYTLPGATITTTEFNQVVIIFMTMGLQLIINTPSGTISRQGQIVSRLNKSDGTGVGTTLQSASKFFFSPSTGNPLEVISFAQEFPTVVDVVATPGTYVYSFGASVNFSTPPTSFTARLATYPIAADNTVFQNTISLLGLKR
jgi:hypothetical protein